LSIDVIEYFEFLSKFSPLHPNR